MAEVRKLQQEHDNWNEEMSAVSDRLMNIDIKCRVYASFSMISTVLIGLYKMMNHTVSISSFH